MLRFRRWPFGYLLVSLYLQSVHLPGVMRAQNTPPAAPSGVTALAGDSEVSLSWSPVASAASYTIWGTTQGLASPVATGVTSTAFTLRGLTNGTTYGYQVSASNSSGQGQNSTTVTVTPTTGASAGSASLLAYEPFDGAAGTLLATGTGAGWTTAWDIQNEVSTVPGYALSTANSLLLSGSSPSPGYATGGSSYLTAGRGLDVTSAGPFAAYLSNGLIGTAGKTLWVSLLMRKDVNTEDWAYVGLHAGSPAWWIQTPLLSLGYFGGDSDNGGTRYWSLQVNGTVYQTNTPVVVGQAALLVLRVDFGATTSTASLYVNPVAGTVPASPGATASSSTSLGFRSFAFFAGSDANQSSIDELRFASDYNSVRTATNAIPIAPVGLTATPSDGQIALSWTGSASATGYQVWATIGSAAAQLLATVSNTSYIATGLTNRVPVSFSIVPVNAEGTGVGTAPVVSVPRNASPAKAGLGTNLTSISDYGRSLPWVDAFKIARPWISQTQGGTWGNGPALALTAEGWVASLAANQFAETILFDNAGDDADADYPTGDYTLLYDGEGTIAFDYGSASIVSQTAGRMVIEVPSGEGIYLKLMTTNPANPMRNIRFIMPGFESTYTTSPFHPQFLAAHQGFKALRFMEWMLTNNSTVQNWTDRPLPSDFTYMWRGVPLEVMVQLANTLHASPWFNMPHLATDDYVSKFATLVNEQLDVSLTAYIEYSNETWNGEFTQAGYVQAEGLAQELSNDQTQAGAFYTALRSTQIFTLWQEVFGGLDRLVRVLPGQAGNAWVSQQVLAYNNAFAYADVLAIAPYYSICSDSASGGWGFLGSPTTQDQVAQLTPDQVLDIEMSHIQNCALTEIQSSAAVASQFGVKMVAYEGGQSLVGTGGAENNDALTALFKAANRSPRMETLYTTYLQNWKTSGGDLFVTYSDTSGYSKFGNWGFFEWQDQDPTTAPKYQALMNFATQNP